MGFLTDIAEIAGLLFVTYMAGWLVGYAAHRLIARAPSLEASTAARGAAAAIAQEPAADALVKAPVVVPVGATPPPQVLAAASAIEPMKATAVPDSGEAATPPESATAPTPAPVVSALDTLKSLSTAMPLMPASAHAATVEPAVVVEVAATSDIEPVTPVAESVEAAAPTEAAEFQPLAQPVPTAAPSEPVAPGSDAAAPVVAVPTPTVDAEIPVTSAPEPVSVPAPSSEPPPPAEPVPAPPPMPAIAPGMPWAGAINGQEAQKFAPEAHGELAGAASEPADPINEPDAALDVALLSSLADQLKVGRSGPAAGDDIAAAVSAEPTAPASSPKPEAVNEPSPPAPIEPAPQPVAPEPAVAAAPSPPPAELVQAPTPPPRPALEEDAAMRAIEGGWSRRDVRALGDAPELTDVTAAVSAAQVAVEQVLARNGVDTSAPDARAQASFGKPAGLPQPRDGRRDSLKRIDGLGPLDEVTLNNLGIYHFDQIAKWSEREVLWLENHAFAVGRIGREAWQDQARELLAERDATRALR